MAQQLMWSQMEGIYRGQAGNFTVVTVEEDAMNLAHKRAGKSVYDTDWWVETLDSVLQNWGISGNRWVDASTQTPRAHFSLGTAKRNSPPAPSTQQQAPPSAPSTSPLGSGPLRSRLQSGALNTKDLNEDK